MVELGNILDLTGDTWDPDERRIRCILCFAVAVGTPRSCTGSRCMEHTVHLAAAHFVKTVSPTSAKALVTKIRRTLKHIKLDDDINLDRLNDDLQEWDSGKGEDEETAQQ